MADTPAYFLADWLTLHELSIADCARLLDLVVKVPPPADDPLADITDPWGLVIGHLGQALPPAGNVLDQIRADVQVDLDPDLTRFPRAFTLHDAGGGLPFVSCPRTGLLSDLLVLGHELGHVCHVLNHPDSPPPPALRETVACLAEWLVARAADSGFPHLAALQAARDHRSSARSARVLGAAMANPSAPYSYDWNYPVARVIARRVVTTLPPDALWDIFRGHILLPDLVRLAIG